MPWPQTGATQYHAGLPDKGRAIKWLVVCNNRDPEPLDLQNGQALNRIILKLFSCKENEEEINLKSVFIEYFMRMMLATLRNRR